MPLSEMERYMSDCAWVMIRREAQRIAQTYMPVSGGATIFDCTFDLRPGVDPVELERQILRDNPLPRPKIFMPPPPVTPHAS